jgi:hypothetical protein
MVESKNQWNHQKVLLKIFPMNGHVSMFRQSFKFLGADSVSCPWWQKSPSVELGVNATVQSKLTAIWNICTFSSRIGANKAPRVFGSRYDIVDACRTGHIKIERLATEILCCGSVAVWKCSDWVFCGVCVFPWKAWPKSCIVDRPVVANAHLVIVAVLTIWKIWKCEP